MTSKVIGTCGRGHWRSLYYETVKSSFPGMVKLTVRKCQVKWRLFFTAAFQLALAVNSKSTYIMKIFLRLWKDILVFLRLLSFSVLFMHVSMGRLKCGQVFCCFLSSLSFRQHVNNFFHQLSKLFTPLRQKQLSRGIL